MLRRALALALCLFLAPGSWLEAASELSRPASSRRPALPNGLPPASPAIPPLISPAGQPGIVPPPRPEIPAAGPQAPAPASPREAPFAELQDLGAAKKPAETAAFHFDGAEPGPPPSASLPQEPASPPAKNGFFKRLRKATGAQSPQEKWFERALVTGVLVGAAAPAAYGVVPVHTSGPLGIMGILPVIYFLGTVSLARFIHFLRGKSPQGKPQGPPEKTPPAPARKGRRFVRLAAAAGLALGSALSGGALLVKAPVIEAALARFEPQAQARWLRGGAFAEETLRQLSRNPVGRKILDGLKDRGGRVHLPDFFVSNQEDSIANYRPLFDCVAIDASEITNRGWTVDEFINSPELQRQLAVELQAVSAHELEHADQYRRPLGTPGQFSSVMEHEYEAYVAHHFYVHEQLKADPSVPIPFVEINNYDSMLNDLEAYKKDLDNAPGYKKNTHLDSDYYRAFLARLRADWPAHRVEGYMLLARRNRTDHPWLAAAYAGKALAAALENDLPPPDLRGLQPF